MKLTPLDVRKQEFSRQVRGYDRDEVHSFLEAVADEYEAALSEKQALAKRLENLEQKLKDYQQMESSLQDAAMTATRAAKEAEVETSRTSKLLVQEARLEAEEIVSEARRKRDRLLDDLANLEGQRRSFLLKMKQVLRGQVELLELLEKERVDQPPRDREDKAGR